ncbi:S8 family serine peptidase [soil metagenome]
MSLKILVIILISLCSLTSYSQTRYVVRFTDKNNSPFSVSSPLGFLSQRAIDRRTKQGISIDQNDLPVNPSYIQSVQNTGATILNVTKWLNAIVVDAPTPTILAAINALPFVQNAVNVGRIKIHSTIKDKFTEENALPLNLNGNESARTSLLSYGSAFTQTAMIGLTDLHDLGYTGQGMIIAVIDAGFFDANNMTCFDSLFLQNRIISTYDFVDHEADVYDDNYHGAAVLSCMAANVPGDFIGTAPDASYILLRSEDANSELIIEEYNWAVAAEYADSAGADVINSSLGYYTFDDPTQNMSYQDMNGNTAPSTIAADLAVKKGMMVVVSAGNEGSSNWNYIGTPADADSVLAIGAVNDLGQYASFSSNGPTADGRVKPDVSAQGANTWLYTPFSSNAVTQANGTSFSSPIMAGASACLWQAWSQMNCVEVMNAIRRSASQFNNPDTLLGFGIPNFSLANSLLSLSEFNIPENAVIHIFPNPWTGNDPAHVLFYSDSSQDITLTLTDLAGRIIKSQKQPVNGAAWNDLELNTVVSSGLYLVRIDTRNSVIVKTIVRR